MTSSEQSAAPDPHRGGARTTGAPAPLRLRIAARLVDGTILVFGIATAWMALGIAFFPDGPSPSLWWFDAAATIVLAAVPFAYELAATKRFGRTVGKEALRLSVVDARTGEAPGWGWAIVRVVPLASLAFGHAVPFVVDIRPYSLADSLWPLELLVLPLCLLPALGRTDNRALHDLLAHTTVVRDEAERARHLH